MRAIEKLDRLRSTMAVNVLTVWKPESYITFVMVVNSHLFLILCDMKLFHFSLSVLLWHSDTNKVSQTTMFSRASSYTRLSTVELHCDGLALCLCCTGPDYPPNSRQSD